MCIGERRRRRGAPQHVLMTRLCLATLDGRAAQVGKHQVVFLQKQQVTDAWMIRHRRAVAEWDHKQPVGGKHTT